MNLETGDILNFPEEAHFVAADPRELIAVTISPNRKNAEGREVVSVVSLVPFQTKPIHTAGVYGIADVSPSPNFKLVAIQEREPYRDPNFPGLGNILAAGNKIVLRELPSGQLRHSFASRKLVWSETGERLAVEVAAGVQVWSSNPLQLLGEFSGRIAAVGAGTAVVNVGGNSFWVIELATAERLSIFSVDDHVNRIDLSEAFEAAIVTTASTSEVIDLRTGRLRLKIGGRETAVNFEGLSPDKRFVSATVRRSGTTDETVIADLKEERTVSRIPLNRDAGADWRDDFRAFFGTERPFGVVVGAGGSLSLWSISNGEARPIEIERVWRSYSPGRSLAGETLNPPSTLVRIHGSPIDVGVNAVVVGKGRRTFVYAIK